MLFVLRGIPPLAPPGPLVESLHENKLKSFPFVERPGAVKKTPDWNDRMAPLPSLLSCRNTTLTTSRAQYVVHDASDRLASIYVCTICVCIIRNTRKNNFELKRPWYRCRLLSQSIWIHPITRVSKATDLLTINSPRLYMQFLVSLSIARFDFCSTSRTHITPKCG